MSASSGCATSWYRTGVGRVATPSATAAAKKAEAAAAAIQTQLRLRRVMAATAKRRMPSATRRATRAIGRATPTAAAIGGPAAGATVTGQRRAGRLKGVTRAREAAGRTTAGAGWPTGWATVAAGRTTRRRAAEGRLSGQPRAWVCSTYGLSSCGGRGLDRSSTATSTTQRVTAPPVIPARDPLPPAYVFLRSSKSTGFITCGTPATPF